MGACLQLEVLAVAVPAGCGAEAVQLLAGSLQVKLQELICPRQLKQPANFSLTVRLIVRILTAISAMQARSVIYS